jgi:hypothetical protein
MLLYAPGPQQIRRAAWADRGTGVVSSDVVLITDIGPTPGTLFWWNGTRWLVLGQAVVHLSINAIQGAANANEQILKQFVVPAGLLLSARMFVVRIYHSKTGTTNTSQARVRLGADGAITDAAIATPTVMSAANLRAASEMWFYPNSATEVLQIQRLGTAFGGGMDSSAVDAAVTVSDLANATTLSVSAQLNGTTNQSELRAFSLELIP